MDTEQSDKPDGIGPFAALAALVLLPLLLLAIFQAHPEPAQRHVEATEQPLVLPDLPASADDTVLTSELAADDAQTRNAAVPIDPAALSPIASFTFRGDSADRTRARDCLALAAMAEAGSGDADQRAVMQVVLNRARHPAFANTVCGVIFEGSQRPSGCQFTFTCDGSLARRYSDAAWRNARARAEEALDGYVHQPVGTATHYHADYVYPYWSPSLDKVAVVGPHIFLRWKGAWGTQRGFSARYAGGEPDPLALRSRAQAVERPADLLPQLVDNGVAIRTITADGASDSSNAAPSPPTTANPGSPDPGVHFVLVSGSDSPQALVDRARALCPGNRYCQVYGWSRASDMPGELPLPFAARSTLRFSYLPARQGRDPIIYFDCRLFPDPGIGTCLPQARP